MKLGHIIACVLLAFTSAFGAESYFPAGTVTDHEQTWYAAHLSAMKEPVLSVRKDDPEYFVFRVLYLPTWGRPVAVRLEKKNGLSIRRAVILTGDGGYDPGKIKDEKLAEMSKTDMGTIVEDIRTSGFWDLTSKDEVMGFDGSQLIIEAIQNGKHVVFVRWTPEHDTAKRGLTKLVTLYARLFQETGLWPKK